MLAVLVLFSISGGTERARSVLVEYRNEIREASRSFGISPRLLASIVYAEHSLNVRPGEAVLDKVLALSGYNASLGMAQIKVETAQWIEKQLQERGGMFYNPLAMKILIEKENEIVNRLTDPRTNLRYAAAYVGMILKVWQPLFREAAYEHQLPSIVATLYSLGLTRFDRTLRLPHGSAKSNCFGDVARSFYDSFELTDELPK
ncbi:MAG: hypothetical protein ABI623_06245 [bacterium]